MHSKKLMRFQLILNHKSRGTLAAEWHSVRQGQVAWRQEKEVNLFNCRAFLIFLYVYLAADVFLGKRKPCKHT